MLVDRLDVSSLYPDQTIKVPVIKNAINSHKELEKLMTTDYYKFETQIKLQLNNERRN